MAGRRATSAPRPPQRGSSRHFLRTPALAEALACDAGITRADVVVDVGAGSGRLTAPLAERAARVYAVERDLLLAERLRTRFARHPSVTVLEADAVVAPLPQEPYRVVANLPFGGGTAILRRLLDDPRLERADVILEWGVARKRASCWPSTLLGVTWGVRFELVVMRRLPAACFDPPPAVDAGLLRIVRRPVPLVAERDHGRFCRFVDAAFRGDLAAGRLLRGRAARRAARGLGISWSDRPRDLDVHQWAALFEHLGDRAST